MFNPKLRHIYLYGGRQSGKTVQIAYYIIMRVLNDHLRPLGEWVDFMDMPAPLDPKTGSPTGDGPYYQRTDQSMKVFCMRQNKNTNDQTMKAEIQKVIKKMGVSHLFEEAKTDDKIICKVNGNEIMFGGMWLSSKGGRNKGLEGVRLTWLEEAAYMSRQDIDELIGTVTREPHWQMIYSFNPRYPDDAVWKDMHDQKDDEDTYVAKYNFYDNPYLNPDTLKNIAKIEVNRPEHFKHAYEGELLSAAEGLVFQPGRRIGQWSKQNLDDLVNQLQLTPTIGVDIGDRSPTVSVLAYVIDETKQIYVQKTRHQRRLPAQYLTGWMFGPDGFPYPRWLYPHDNPEWKAKCQYPLIDYHDIEKYNIWVDPANQHEIDRFKDSGLTHVHDAFKPADSIFEGIKFIHNYNLVINPNTIPGTNILECEQILKELPRYFHKLLPNQTDAFDWTKFEDSDWNHAIDALRYALTMRIFPEKAVSKTFKLYA